jgi:dihydrofolate reductase
METVMSLRRRSIVIAGGDAAADQDAVATLLDRVHAGLLSLTPGDTLRAGPPASPLAGMVGPVGKLIYSAITSLDGYIRDATGDFGWAAPDEEVHRFINDLERPVGTYLYGRGMYETMCFWETADDPEPVMTDYAAIWRAADKVVYSSTLAHVSSERTRIERAFDPESVRRMVASSAADVSIAGPTLAADAIAAGIVDEVQLFVVPIVVGGGKRALPDNVVVPLELVDERRFARGTVYLRYRRRD